jgi:hypothetical protein
MTSIGSYEPTSANDRSGGPQVGDKAPEFLIDGPLGTLKLSGLAERVGVIVLVSQDSYRFHGR